MTQAKQPDALQLAQFFESMKKSSHRWHDGTPVHERVAAELRRLHGYTSGLEADRDSAFRRLAEEKLRADQMTEQHRMQCNMRRELEARAQPAREPLTDEQIDNLAIDADGLPNSHLEFARAIEAAHGIKATP